MIAAEKITVRRTSIARSAWIRVLGVSVMLIALPFVFRLDGRAHGDWLQFFGRFHPVLLHLPIGLIVLVPVLEITGVKRPALREAAGFVLSVALIVALPTLALGYMLAYGAGDSGTTVTLHMSGAIALCIGLMLCVLMRPAWAARAQANIYPSLLVATLLVLVWTSHQGGSISHGSDYLTHYMPTALRPLLRISSGENVSPDSFYARHINPVLDAKCVSCHSASNAKAGLRLDTYDRLMRGGQDGTSILPGKPDASMLLKRVTLPNTDRHFMPAEGRTPLTTEEISWIRAWILAGASPIATTVPGVNIAADHSEPPPQPVDDYSALMPEILRMQQGQGAKLVPVSGKASDGLILRTVDISSTFGDAQLAQLQKFAPYIVEAELGRTAVTDAAFDTLSRFTHLRALHLEGTSITGTGIAKLSALSQLTYLNLSSTKVTPDSVTVLKKMPNLRHVYLFNTAAQPDDTSARKTP
ncbi:c-type cytochrome domain-containing protein [Acidicapsa dinghuensis]|uniref:C-type cytochrome domain-containing protein n=1 Tax=Acidicapsa dinghuensis TaxID=2218256 RepID=A0ABW1ELY3_9BACT|nr:c-type cytochrome domain-containing protein [Acidicapsa dinghuensis]